MLYLSFAVAYVWMLGCSCRRIYELDVRGEARYGYYIAVEIGTPSQLLNILVDTGSSNTAVLAVPFQNGSSKYFHSNESRTLHTFTNKIDLHYSEGLWSGFLASDVIRFCAEQNCSLHCIIVCISSVNKTLDVNYKFQGVLGLAYPSLTNQNLATHSFMDTLVEVQNVSNIFALALCGPYFHSKQQTSTACGKFHIGYMSDKYCDVVYTPLVKEWYYEVVLTDMMVGTNHITCSCLELNKGSSIIDSGTTELNLPEVAYKWVVSEIKHHIKDHPDYIWENDSVICSNEREFFIMKFPVLTLSFLHTSNSSFNLVIHPELYLLPLTFKNYASCVTLAIGKSNFGVVVGSTILKGFYVIFDRVNKRIGFANSSDTSHLLSNIGSVSLPNYTDGNFDHCKKGKSDESEISALTIVLLCCSVACAVILLYTLLTWIWRQFILRSFDSSETSSLVDDD
ncbi:beta-secretase 1-like [Stegodyphus dumicola]|uniref:beta-secretase 1-like n=1 Tax=Stegodyphus dumicola TaxID=202533 RepID=UPI0015ABA247|nr:beta-secretase 1-like [Stegodyphus dumicola]